MWLHGREPAPLPDTGDSHGWTRTSRQGARPALGGDIGDVTDVAFRSQSFFNASIRSCVPGWVASIPPLLAPSVCTSQVSVLIITILE